MATVTIKTAQNVSIDYQLATWVERFLAFILDMLVIIIGGLILFFMLLAIFGGEAVIGTIVTIIVSFYTLVLEMTLRGQTLGKKLMKIRVIQLTGEIPTLSSYLSRWSFRLFEIFMTGGVLATVLCGTSKYAQRLGDILGNTIVIKEKESKPVFLKEILQLKNKTQADVMYPNVTAFSEEEMLFTKNTLSRIKKYPNEAHRKAFDLLYTKISEKLGVEVPKPQREALIKQVIKDYIVLTR